MSEGPQEDTTQAATQEPLPKYIGYFFGVLILGLAGLAILLGGTLRKYERLQREVSFKTEEVEALKQSLETAMLVSKGLSENNKTGWEVGNECLKAHAALIKEVSTGMQSLCTAEDPRPQLRKACSTLVQ